MHGGFGDTYELAEGTRYHRLPCCRWFLSLVPPSRRRARKKYHRLSFYPWFLKHLAASGIFSGLAVRHCRNEEYMSAAISYYYFLFHLSMGMLFMAPDLTPYGVQSKLAEDWVKKDKDPSKRIEHDDVRDFLGQAERRGLLSRQFLTRYDIAREMREFFNYAPPVHARRRKIRFFSCNHSPVRLQDMLREAHQLVGESARAITEIAADSGASLARDLRRDANPLTMSSEFGYADWCPQDVLEAARRVCTEVADTLDAGGSAAR